MARRARAPKRDPKRDPRTTYPSRKRIDLTPPLFEELRGDPPPERDREARPWIEEAVDCIDRMRHRLPMFTADDLRARAGNGPSPGSVGAAFAIAAARGLIEEVGERPSMIESNRGRKVKEWKTKS